MGEISIRPSWRTENKVRSSIKPNSWSWISSRGKPWLVSIISFIVQSSSVQLLDWVSICPPLHNLQEVLFLQKWQNKMFSTLHSLLYTFSTNYVTDLSSSSWLVLAFCGHLELSVYYEILLKKNPRIILWPTLVNMKSFVEAFLMVPLVANGTF